MIAPTILPRHADDDRHPRHSAVKTKARMPAIAGVAIDVAVAMGHNVCKSEFIIGV